MRARNLKPGFFVNEDLGSSDPLTSLVFLGLVASADRKGILEDRPRRIRAEVFPYRFEVDMESHLGFLAEHGFISRYVSPCGTKLIHVTRFLRHQNPHQDERASRWLTPTEIAEGVNIDPPPTRDLSRKPRGSRGISGDAPAESLSSDSPNRESSSSEGGISASLESPELDLSESGGKFPPRGNVEELDFPAGRSRSSKSRGVEWSSAVRQVVDAWNTICEPSGSVFVEPSESLIEKKIPLIDEACRADKDWVNKALQVIEWLPTSEFNSGRVPPLKENGKPYVQSFAGLIAKGQVSKKFDEMVRDKKLKEKLALAASHRAAESAKTQESAKQRLIADALERQARAVDDDLGDPSQEESADWYAGEGRGEC